MLKFDRPSIARCIDCRGCEHDCPSFKTLTGYDPTRVNRDILAGKAESWLTSEMIWQCLECHTCTEMCPQNYSWEKVMTALKSEAMKRGLGPKMVKKGIETFLRTGRLGDPRPGVRKSLGLPDLPSGGQEDFLKMAETLKVQDRLQPSAGDKRGP